LTNQAIYGYRKDPENHNKWLVDESIAPIVKRIFQMTIDRKGPYQIARRVNETGNIYAVDIDDLRGRYDELWGQTKEILHRLSAL
jgi:glutamyl-tRNA reductase